MRRAIFSALIIAATVATAHAEPAALHGDALRQLAAGRTVHLHSPYGVLPVSFNANGTLSGSASGTLAAYLGSTSDRGRWSVKGNRICQTFSKWFDGATHCLQVRQDGRRIHWQRDDGLSGTATISGNGAPRETQPARAAAISRR